MTSNEQRAKSFTSNIDEFTDADYKHPKRVWKDLKNLGEYYDLHILSDTLLLANVFENFRNKCIEIYELDSAPFLSAPELAWEDCLKKQE